MFHQIGWDQIKSLPISFDFVPVIFETHEGAFSKLLLSKKQVTLYYLSQRTRIHLIARGNEFVLQ